MHPAAKLQFERMIGEFARWHAVPEDARSPAPAWWWGPAIELHSIAEPLPVEWCAELGLPDGATFGAGADVFLRAMAGETLVPWPYDFPCKAAMGKAAIAEPDVRDLHPQPTDDSAFPL
jgi:hypothetical protein